jgi:broad specificity phosphatase PhoE
MFGVYYAAMEIYLVRHGQSEANAGLTENLDSDLTEIGRRQASLTADRLHALGVTRAYVSPLRRTLETMSAICGATGLCAEVTADACEYFSARWPGYRTFQGLSPSQIETEFPFAVFGSTFPCEPKWWPQAPEDGQIVYARSVRVRDALLTQFAATDEHLVLVSHADTVGRLIEAFLRIPPDPERPPWSDNCAISRLSCPADPTQPAIPIVLNDTSHLPGLVT